MFSVSLARSERPSYLRSFSFVLLLAALVPILMPSRVLAVDIGGSTFSADTTLTSGDTWTVGNVTINGGVTVTVPGAATVMMNSGANVNLSGLGTLAIDATGLFQHATTTSGDNIVVTDAGSILNNGTYEFTTGGDIQLKGSGSTFYNNGLLTKTGINASSNDPSHIFPNSTSSGGTFINTGDITVTAGHLNIAGGSSTGGNFTTTSGAMLSFSGRWSELTGVADNSAGGFIGTSAQDPAGTTGARFEAAAATTVLNVTGTGLVLGTGAVDVHGNVLQNQGLLVIGSSQNPEIVDLFGGGTFVNASGGTVLLDKGSLTLTATGLTNEGTLTLNDGETGVTDIVTINGPNAITNVTGGVVNLEDGNLVLNTALTNEGTMVLNAGTTSTTRVLISGTTPLTNSATGTFSLQKGLMTLNGNNVVNDGVTNYDGAVAVTFDGTGRFINNGTFNHQVSSGNDNLTLNGTVVFENNGTFDFQEKGEIDLTGAGAVFLNNGVLMKTVAGSDPSYVFRNGSFTAAAGSEVISQAGLLHFGVDGTSDAAATWTADGGTLQIAGEWTGTIAGESVSDGAGGFSYVQIGNSGNGSVNSVLAIGTAGLTFDIAGGGLRWEGTTIDTQGNTMTSVGGFLVDSTATRTLSGGGELVIGSGGTFDHVRGTVTLADNSILRNQGTTTYVNGTTATSAYSGAGEFINDALGTVNYQGGTLQVNAGVTYRNQGQFNLENAGSFSGDGVILNDTMGTMTWVAGNFGIADGTEVINNGLFEASASGNRLVTGTGTFTNNGVYNQSITDNNGDNVGWSGAGNFVNHGEFNFTDNSDYQMEGGTTFTNAADGILTVATTENTDPAQFFSFVSTAGSGTFDNQGTVEVTSGVFRVTGSLAGAAQFEDVVLVQNNGTGGLTGGTWIADSTDTGTARIDLNTFGTTSGITSVEDGAVVDLTGAAAQVVQLSSLATLNGELYVNGAQNFSGSGSVMVGSTGILGGDGAIADSLTINGLVTPGTTQGADLGILTMGSDATFGSTSTINLGLGAVLGTVNGGLDPVAMGNAILALGDLDPTGNQHDALDINGTLTLDPSMTINVFNEGVTFAAGQFFDLLDFANVAGINGVDDAQAAALLNLPDPGALAWDTSLFRSNGIVYLTDPLVIPEPGRAVLLGMAALGLLLRRRRK